MTESHPSPKLRRGRPPKPAADRKQAKSIRIAPDVANFLATQENQNATIEAAIRRSKAFRDWWRAANPHRTP
jgi:hypothetical protein